MKKAFSLGITNVQGFSSLFESSAHKMFSILLAPEATNEALHVGKGFSDLPRTHPT